MQPRLFELLSTEKAAGKVSYSPTEQRLFKYLARGRMITTTSLMQLIYGDRLDENFHARETLNAALSSLRRKLIFDKEAVRLCSSQLSGPYPKKWWVEPLATKPKAAKKKSK